MKPKIVKAQVGGVETNVALLGANGLPIFVKDDNTEIEYDAARNIEGMTRVSEERDALRRKVSEFETLVNSLPKDSEGKTVSASAIADALAKVAALKGGDLKTAEDLQKMRQEVESTFAKTLKEKEAEHRATTARLESVISQSVLTQNFGGSKFLKDKTTFPHPNLALPEFGGMNLQRDADGKIVGGHGFHVDTATGKVTGYSNGKPILDPSNPFEPAPFDTAFEVMVKNHPLGNHILKGTGGGSGRVEGEKGANASKSMPREEFNSLPQVEKETFMRSGGKLS